MNVSRDKGRSDNSAAVLKPLAFAVGPLEYMAGGNQLSAWCYCWGSVGTLAKKISSFHSFPGSRINTLQCFGSVEYCG